MRAALLSVAAHCMLPTLRSAVRRAAGLEKAALKKRQLSISRRPRNLGSARDFEDLKHAAQVNVFVVWSDEAAEPVSLANAVDGWQCVAHTRMRPREGGEKTPSYFGLGQIERLKKRLAIAATATDALELDDNEATYARAWRARALDKPLRVKVGTPEDQPHEPELLEPREPDDGAADGLNSELEPWLLPDEMLVEHGEDDEPTLFQDRTGGSRLVLFVDTPSLRASQRRYLSDALGVPVFDRFSIVLNIFKSRARSKEVCVQRLQPRFSSRLAPTPRATSAPLRHSSHFTKFIESLWQALLRLELATLRHRRANLVDALADLDQQRGGHTMDRGPGNKRIQIMRSTINEQTSALEDKLSAMMSRSDAIRRKRRERSASSGRRLPVICLVGYTNAGKSLLHAQLAGSEGDPSRADRRRSLCFARHIHGHGSIG